jgi:plastocyanin
MTFRSNARRATGAALGMASTLSLTLALSGCGGSGQDSGDAVVVTEPGASVSTAPAPTAAAPSSSTPAATAPAAGSATAAAPVKAEGWGTLKGQVVFGGDAPAQPVLQEKGKAEKDAQFCAKDKPILSEKLIVDGGTKGVKNVFVYIPKPTAVNEEAKSAKSSADVVFDQENCTFVPHALAVLAGSKVNLKSSDPVSHNINAKLQKNPAFNSLLAGGGTASLNLASAERAPVPVTCDIHPWMQAYWLVLDNPYFAVTDDKGNFEIKNVPAGTQKVVVWQESAKFVTPPSGQDVTVKANDAISETFTINPSNVK